MRRKREIILFACQSFAWFTSKDEVTNRLSASSDYGVSIVESFAPPKNWIPGQEINKDVYDVNTGNIEAFVNNDISGVFNYTVEELEANTTNLATKGVKLNEQAATAIDGATTMEAGAVLAWTSTSEPLGAVSAKRKTEPGNTTVAWKPTETGTYVFRRSIDGSSFTYAGYYYDAATDTYYKIVLGDDINPRVSGTNQEFDVSTTNLGASVVIDENGVVTSGTPVVKYVVENKKENVAANFVLDSANKRLVVTPAAAASSGSTDTAGNVYNASSDAARAEVEYLNQKRISDIATKAYNQTKADYDYALALTQARNTLVGVASTTSSKHAEAEDATNGTNQLKANALSGVKTTAGNIITDTAGTGYKVFVAPDPSIQRTDLITGEPYTKISAFVTANPDSQVAKNWKKLDDLYKAMYDDSGYADKVKGTLEYLRDTADYDAATATAKLALLKSQINDLKAALSEYRDTFANLSNSASTATELTAVTATVDAAKTAVKACMDAADTLLTAIDNASNTELGLKKKVEDYVTASNNAASKNQEVKEQDAKWTAAVAAYNAAVTNAKNKYTADIAKTQYDGNGLTDNSLQIVPTYADSSGTAVLFGKSANGKVKDTDSDADCKEPTIAANTAYTEITAPTSKPVVTTLTEPTEATFGTIGNDTADTKVNKLREKMNTEIGTTNTKKAALDEAIKTLEGASDITIYVNLDGDYATNWTLDAAALKSTPTTASFYLNKILGVGETTDKLVESVKLADTVKASAYKNMTFDLNVALDSAQITYDANDQSKITTDAVTANTDFVLKPTLANPNDLTTAVSWS